MTSLIPPTICYASCQPLHDVCAAYYAIHPEMFDTKKFKVDIECSSSFSYGQTVVDQFDLRKLPPTAKNVNVALKMNVGEFWKTFLVSLGKADVVSSLNYSKTEEARLTPICSFSTNKI